MIDRGRQGPHIYIMLVHVDRKTSPPKKICNQVVRCYSRLKLKGMHLSMFIIYHSLVSLWSAYWLTVPPMKPQQLPKAAPFACTAFAYL